VAAPDGCRQPGFRSGVRRCAQARTIRPGCRGSADGADRINTWAAFAGSDEKAVVDGDFAMLEGELQSVLKALRATGIYIVAIHQHISGEQPRILFLHYWGVGRTEDLARGLRAALDRTAAGTYFASIIDSSASEASGLSP